MRSATPPCTSPSTPELSTMYDDDITPQYEYILQHYESQDMARAVSQDSFGSAVSVHSVGLGCATPDTMLSIPDLFQGDLSQQLQHIPVATGLDQNHMAYENSHDAYGTNFQEQTETPWTNNTVMDGGVVPYPDGLVYRGGSYGQQGVPTWDYPIQEVDGYWQQQQQQQQQQYPEMQTIEHWFHFAKEILSADRYRLTWPNFGKKNPLVSHRSRECNRSHRRRVHPPPPSSCISARTTVAMPSSIARPT
ncbi:hypothetical protein MCOR25_007879 [Pyricularia grisea]|nr:hypothetical protein MCOR25_007879 [Pyricularia grisea]